MTVLAPRSNTVFTIGHSNLELAVFVEMLNAHGVKSICDVRSRPGSFRFPQFNRETLEALLELANIHYQFLGDSLGGRPADPHAYHQDGLEDYLARQKAPDFSAGVDRVLEFSAAGNIVLMCAEEDPLQCHRFLMICPALTQRGVVPVHLRKGGALESQSAAEDRLLARHDLTAFGSGSLFASERGLAIEGAIRRQSREYAFRNSAEALDSF